MTTLTSQPQKGAGTQFWRIKPNQAITSLADVTNDLKWDRIAKIKQFQPSEITVQDIEDDYLDDDDSEWTKTTAGTKTAGEVSLTIAWMPGDPIQQKLAASIKASELTYYRAKYKSGAVSLYYGYINSLGGTVEINNIMTRTIKIKLVGEPKTAEEFITEVTS